MYHPSRGGVRGGRDQFNWDDVKSDKHRENYLGHSVKAPVGRWQRGKDLNWYAKERHSDDAAAKEEIKRIQEEEEEAMQEMLGLAPKKSKHPHGNRLDQREVSELLKRGVDKDEPAPEYAAGERVQGLGFAPAPGQTGTIRATGSRDFSAIPAKASIGKEIEVHVQRDDVAVIGDRVNMKGEIGGESSSSEDERSSHRKRKGEKYKAKEHSRDKKPYRRAGIEDKLRSREVQSDSHQKDGSENKTKGSHDSQEAEVGRGANSRRDFGCINVQSRRDSYMEEKSVGKTKLKYDTSESESSGELRVKSAGYVETQLRRDHLSKGDGEGKYRIGKYYGDESEDSDHLTRRSSGYVNSHGKRDLAHEDRNESRSGISYVNGDRDSVRGTTLKSTITCAYGDGENIGGETLRSTISYASRDGESTRRETVKSSVSYTGQERERNWGETQGNRVSYASQDRESFRREVVKSRSGYASQDRETIRGETLRGRLSYVNQGRESFKAETLQSKLSYSSEDRERIRGGDTVRRGAADAVYSKRVYSFQERSEPQRWHETEVREGTRKGERSHGDNNEQLAKSSTGVQSGHHKYERRPTSESSDDERESKRRRTGNRVDSSFSKTRPQRQHDSDQEDNAR